MRFLFLSVLFLCLSAQIQAQNAPTEKAFDLFFTKPIQKDKLSPPPQHAEWNGWEIPTPQTFSFHFKGKKSVAVQNLLQKFPQAKNGFKIFLNSQEKSGKTPTEQEGYFLKIENKRITIASRSPRGLFYGLKTLEQLLQSPTLPLGEITDYPDIAFRGVVEGFYGTPWSYENRLSQLSFYPENKINTYIYAPKDDPYHSSPNWREPYPENQAQRITNLVQKAQENNVDFYWAIHPGKDIQWNETDRALLLKKFQAMYDLGVRAFAVFFDDISGEGTNANKQAELLNYIDNQFIKIKKDVRPLIMCPTEYNKSWANLEKGYLPTLGEKLNPSIQIMWTGDRVVADVTPESLAWIHSVIKRKAFFWWNFPVSDYVRDHLLLGPSYGLDTSVKNNLAGIVSNPMEHAEASKVAIAGLADYAWNLEAYNSLNSWKQAIAKLFPKDYEAYEFFSEHNADLGANGHRYRRDESWNFKPLAEKIKSGVESNSLTQTQLEQGKTFFAQMQNAAQTLLKNTEQPHLIQDIAPWLEQFALLGKVGEKNLLMYQALENQQKKTVEDLHQEIISLKEKMYQLDRSQNQNPYQPGVKTATLVVSPLVNHIFSTVTQKFNQKYGANLVADPEHNPHKIFTNIPQLAQQPLRIDNRNLSISPALEVVKIAPGQFIGIELEKSILIKQIAVNLGIENLRQLFQVQISADGKQWQFLPGNPKGNPWQFRPNTPAQYVRILNSSGAEQSVYLKQFSIKTQ